MTCLKKYRNKFFDKIGYKDSATESLFYGNLKEDKRNKRWKEERKKVGRVRFQSRLVFKYLYD